MRAGIVLAVTTVCLACGSSGSSPANSEVDLRSTGVSPNAISVASNSALLFDNHDTVNHQIVSSDCSELNSQVLTPNATFTALIQTGPKTCSYGDNLNPAASAFQGTVSVQAPLAGH